MVIDVSPLVLALVGLGVFVSIIAAYHFGVREGFFRGFAQAQEMERLRELRKPDPPQPKREPVTASHRPPSRLPPPIPAPTTMDIVTADMKPPKDGGVIVDVEGTRSAQSPGEQAKELIDQMIEGEVLGPDDVRGIIQNDRVEITIDNGQTIAGVAMCRPKKMLRGGNYVIAIRRDGERSSEFYEAITIRKVPRER